MDDLIYNQHDIPADKWRYGFRTSAATGCGWIATYNALRLLGYRVDIEELITWYERMLPLIHGNAGTAFPAPALRFKTCGSRPGASRWSWCWTRRNLTKRRRMPTCASSSTAGGRVTALAPILWPCSTRKMASSATTPSKIPPAPTVMVPAWWIS